MHSKRILKKEFNNFTNAFISDAFGVIGTHPDKRETVIAMISDVVSLRNDTIVKVNHPEVPEGSSLQAYLRDLRKDFNRDLDAAYQELSKAVSPSKKPAGSAAKSKKSPVEAKKKGDKESSD